MITSNHADRIAAAHADPGTKAALRCHLLGGWRYEFIPMAPADRPPLGGRDLLVRAADGTTLFVPIGADDEDAAEWLAAAPAHQPGASD